MRSEKIRKILSETSDETKESVRQYANKRIMEGNEVEKAARDYAKKEWKYWTWSEQCEECAKDFTAGANWQKERENAELTRTSKEPDAMTTK